MLCVVYADDEFDSLLADVHNRSRSQSVLCGERVSQMTKTYDDVEAVTRLLDEKEKDLELAARIGQGLLARNKALEERLVTVENELGTAHDAVTQLRHDLSLKAELLQIYTTDLDDSSPEGVRAFTCDSLQRKVKGLEDDNRKLRAEASQLVRESSESDLREEQILSNVIAQLAEANQHIKGLDDELADKYEESHRQREEITSLLSQMVTQKHKIRDLTLENEELLMQLKVVRECQNELAAELSEYKDKYAEVLVLLHETQEQLREQNKRSFPTARSVTSASGHHSLSRMPSSSYHPDSLASELELSSLGSEGWPPSEFSTPQSFPRYQFQRVFDTVRCASQPIPSLGSTNLTSTPVTSAPPPFPRVSTGAPSGFRTEPSPSLLKAQTVLKDLAAAAEIEYPASSKVGVPGTPGTVDLAHALRRLTPKTSGSDGEVGDGRGCQTPDSILSTGSRSGFSSLNAMHHPGKLKIIKPIEGSTTLHHWSRLATPNLATVLEERPGVTTRETDGQHRKLTQEFTNDLLEMYSLFDVEEDEEMIIYPGKSYGSSTAVFTYTNSTALHSTSTTHVMTSVGRPRPLVISHDSGVDVISSSNLPDFQCRRTGPRQTSDGCWEWSGLSTPNNSPERTPPGTPPNYLSGPLGLLSQGAEMIRRKWTGEETPIHQFQSVPRIPTKELEVLGSMNLMEKLEKLGLDEVSQRSSPVSPTALMSALQNLATSYDTVESTFCNNASLVIDAVELKKSTESPLRRNHSTQSMESLRKSPMHRSASEQTARGLNMICDLGSPTLTGSHCNEIRAKFQDFDYPSSASALDGL